MRRCARLVSYMHHIADCEQYCQVGNKASHSKFGIFQIACFAGSSAYSTATSVFMLRGGSCRICSDFTNKTFLKQEILTTTTQRSSASTERHRCPYLSPTMRHVSRTHQVDCDRLTQLVADILTARSFTRDRRLHYLHLSGLT